MFAVIIQAEVGRAGVSVIASRVRAGLWWSRTTQDDEEARGSKANEDQVSNTEHVAFSHKKCADRAHAIARRTALVSCHDGIGGKRQFTARIRRPFDVIRRAPPQAVASAVSSWH